MLCLKKVLDCNVRMNSAVPCNICNEGGHKASDCPTLYDPLKEGFYSGGGGGGGHSHDDEDEAADPLTSGAHERVFPSATLG